MADTVSSDIVAQDQLRAFVERIERIESEIADLNSGKSEIYAEAKGNGFDVKVLRKIIADRRKDYAARLEFETIYDLYAAALGMLATPREIDDEDEASHVHAREANKFQAKASEGKTDTAAQSAAPPGGDASRTSRGVDTPATVFMQEDGVEGEGQAGADEHGSGESSQPLIPSDRVENKPDAPAVIAGAPSHAGLTDKSGVEQSTPAPITRLKTTDEVADDMGLPPTPHPLCRKPATCGRFAHVKPCPTCRGEQGEAA